MTMTYVAYDTRSGKILSVHHGAIDADEARVSAEHCQHHRTQDTKINDKHIGMLPIPPDVFGKEELYRVDIGRKVLVTATAEDGGVGFGFGKAGG